MIVPLVILDCSIKIYRVAKVRRADYIVLDRQRLDYLNFIEKFHFSDGAYASGVVACTLEIMARTEQ